MEWKNLSKWKKAFIVLVIFNVLVVIIDLIVIFLYGSQIIDSMGWLFGNENKTILTNLLFIEGALTIGIGALLAGGYSENKLTPTKSPSTSYSVEKLSKQRMEFRKEQISTGLLIILAGLPLIIMSILTASI
jgi:hypothetical protein